MGTCNQFIRSINSRAQAGLIRQEPVPTSFAGKWNITKHKNESVLKGRSLITLYDDWFSRSTSNIMLQQFV